MTVDQLVRLAGQRLLAAGRASGSAEARTLMAHVLQTTSAGLLSAPSPDEAQSARFEELVTARLAGTPVQHLTGEAWFRTVRVEVGPGVFVPRPETETMVGWAISALTSRADDGSAPVVVELCAGSGAISKALAVEAPGCELHAVEISPEAVAYARRNLGDVEVELVEGDMAEAFPELGGLVDLVVANPPYIPLTAWESVAPDVRDHDPALALFSGEDGLEALRVVAAVARRLLRPGGLVCAEHAEVQHHSAPQIFVDAGFVQVRDQRDLTGRPRFVTAVAPAHHGRMGE